MVVVNIYTFEKRDYHPYANSLCRSSCFKDSSSDFLSFQHINSISLYTGFLILMFRFLVYKHQHFYYIKERNYKNLFNTPKIFLLRFLIFLVCSVPLIIGVGLKVILKNWTYFIVSCIFSCLFFISYFLLLPFLLKSLNVDFPCDLFLTDYYVQMENLEKVVKGLPFDFKFDYDTISLLEKRRNSHMIKRINQNFRKYYCLPCGYIII